MTSVTRYTDENLTYDLHPNSRSSLKDLSKVFFEEEYLPAAFSSDVLETNNRSYEERLSSLRMIYSVEEPLPTVLGLLAIGKNPQEYIFGAYVQFLRFDGTGLSDPIIDAKELKGPLPAIIKSTEEKFNAHNRIAVDPRVFRLPEPQWNATATRLWNSRSIGGL